MSAPPPVSGVSKILIELQVDAVNWNTCVQGYQQAKRDSENGHANSVAFENLRTYPKHLEERR